MKFGIYLSLLDRNISYCGDSPRYNEFFVKQLTELLTEYGKIDEIWLDGTNEIGIDGKNRNMTGN